MTFDRYSALLMGPMVSPVKGPGQVDDQRARRRVQKRDEVALVAIRLFVDRGFDAVTVDEIAEAADIAPRTFFRYFASKDDVLFTDHEERLEQLRELIAASPADEPILTTVRHTVEELVRRYLDDTERMLLASQVVAATPALQARSIERQDGWEDELAGMVAARLDVDPAVDLRRFVAATTLAAMRSAVRLWAAGGGTGDVLTLVDHTLDLLDGGLHHESELATAPRHRPAHARRRRS